MVQDVDRDIVVKKSVELMRSGATLLAEVCPVCKSPLFKLRSGEVVCPVHGRIMVVRTEEEIAEAGILSVLIELEKKISSMLVKYIRKIDSDNISYEDARDIVYWLDSIERIERIKQILKQPSEQRREKEEEREREKS